jgi:flagellar biosynthesis/type III secretory pathway protein FliH
MNEVALENKDGLADTEITRLISLSNQASYSRSDILPVREPSPFEPKSLVEIAMAAQKRRDEAKAHAAAEMAMAKQIATEQGSAEQTATSEPASTEASLENIDTADVDVSSEMASESAMGAGQPDNAETDIAATSIAKKIDASDSLADTQAEQQTEVQSEKPVQTPSVPTTPNVPDPAILEAEYKRGQEAGLAEGQAKAAEQLEKVLQNFEQAVLALADPEALDVSALSALVASRVMALASDRAGQAITDMPEAFAKRIENLITMVKSETANPTINLNSEDFASIRPLAQNREKLKACNFVVDETMSRGDVRLAVGGVGLIDEIANRTNVQILEDDKIVTTESLSESSDASVTADVDEVVEAKPSANNPSADVAEDAPTPDAEDNGNNVSASVKDKTKKPVSADDDVPSDKVPLAEAIKSTDDSET